MPTYLSWSDTDLVSVERALKRYKTAGLEASFDLGKAADGIVTISQVDPRVADAPIISFEIHKLARPDSEGRLHWVVQLSSIGGRRQALTMHGCVSASLLVFALAKADQDVQQGFKATDSFDMAANAYWLK